MNALARGAAMNLRAVPDNYDSSLDSARVVKAVDAFLAKDHFVSRNGVTSAGTYLLLDFYNAEKLGQLGLMERAMRHAVVVATL